MSNAGISPNTGNISSGIDFANQPGNFNFGITSPAPSVDFNSFQMSSTGFNFDGKNEASPSVSGVNFGLTSTNHDTNSPIGAFNFDGGNNTNTDSFNFSFGGNVTSPQDESSNNFAFSF